MEVPESVEQHMATAAAAFPVVQEEESNITIDLTDVESVAEPEGERAEASQSMDVDQQTVGEPEPDEEMMASDEDDAPGEVEERRPLLVPTRVHDVNPEHEIALAAMRPHLHTGMGQGTCIDVNPVSSAYMAYLICYTMYKNWNTMASWLSMPYDVMQKKFAAGQRYDILGNWSEICDVDPTTHVSKDLTDEEILEVIRKRAAEGKGNTGDADGRWIAPDGVHQLFNASSSHEQPTALLCH